MTSSEQNVENEKSKYMNGALTQKDGSKNGKKNSCFPWKRNNKISDEKSTAPPLVPYYKLFRFASRGDLLLIWLGIITSVMCGFLMPFLIVLYGEFTDVLVGSELNTTTFHLTSNNYIIPSTQEDKGLVSGQSDFMTAVSWFGGLCCAIGLVQIVLDYLFVTSLNISAEKQILRIRTNYLRQVLRQNVGWYDTNQTGDFASRLTEDLVKLQGGMGDKLGMFLSQLTTFCTSIAISFAYGWQLTLVVLCCMPFVIASTAVVAKMQTSLTERELSAYATAGAVCEEVLASIRTVMAFGGQNKEGQRYAESLKPAARTAHRRGLYTGLGNGVMWFVTFATYSVSFWYGVSLVIDSRDQENPEYTPGSMCVVFFGVLNAAMVMGQAAPFLEAFSVARGAAASVFSLLDREPEIDSFSESGVRPDSVQGAIKFCGVNFAYPSRTEVTILQDLQLEVKRGETVALVGSSGCGKSTCLQLLQRFYDPNSGTVELDGLDICKLNVSWLRSQIGVVGQEPVLFDASILENIRQGRPGASLDEVRNAAREAQADDFIMELPKQYETLVGERGAQLSGGQKQRIAIARALVRNPAILLLDEATSALDSNSEAQVQYALEQASKGRTTIIVAHRLTTVRGADRIVVLGGGGVLEEGTHEHLLAKKGHYFELVATQTSSALGEDTDGLLQDDDVKNKGRSEKERRWSEVSEKISDNKDLIQTQTENGDNNDEAPLSRILKLNQPEWKEITLGCVGAFLVGCSMPIFAVLFGDIYGVLSLSDPEDVRSGSKLYSILFLVTGVVTGIGAFLQMYMFNVAGAKMTMRLRERSFGAILRQEPAWFDEQKNSTGALCARLAGDAASVQGATGTRVGTIIQTFATLALGLCLALFYSWKLGLVAGAFVPFVFVSILLESRVNRAHNIRSKVALEAASKLATESISNIRTVAGLGREKTVVEKYTELLVTPHVDAIKAAHLHGFVFGLGQAMPFMGYGISLYYGGYLVYYEGLHYENIIKVTEALIYGTVMLGQALAFAPDFSQAKVSANKIIKLLERQPQIYDAANAPSSIQKNWHARGEVNFRDVEFSYPSRLQDKVLRGVSMSAKQGQTVAFVGPSGCGKSTCLQLLQRFYEPMQGFISLDGHDVSSLPLETLRGQLGVVSQEPVLFDRTLAENIAYGDNSRQVPMDEVIQAARSANIHNFITALPQGYETRLGERGGQLSGGQKQRVAIARALVRNPRVLLLDEATSALDTESEKVVQAALDEARKGRTCIVIAHRLSTVQDADVICVVHKGRVVESGTHTELLAKRGAYYRLHSLQVS